MHPLVVALAIVLEKNEDFSLINEDHPELLRHKYYDPSRVFPDLSAFYPAREDCWWEDLGASHFSSLVSLSHHKATAAQTCREQMPQEPVTSKEPKEPAKFEQPAVPHDPTAPATLPTPATPATPKKLTVHDQPATAALAVPIRSSKLKILPPKRPGKASKGGDGEIDGAQAEKVSIYCLSRFLSDCLGRSLSSNASERPPKRVTPKSLPSAVLQRPRHKPMPQSTQIPMDPLGSPLSPSFLRFVLFISPIQSSKNWVQCERCVARSIKCESHPTRACKQCHDGKVGCSLMPRNVTTGKVNRHILSAKEVFEYRLEQRRDPKLRTVGPQKGKKPEISQDDNQQTSGSRLSPSASLAKMTLDSTPSRGNSPVPEQELGTSSVLLPVASITPQIPAPSSQGYQQTPLDAPTLSQLSNQLSNEGRNLAARLAGLEENLGGLAKNVAGLAMDVAGIEGRLGGLVKGVTAWRKDFEQKFIGSQ